MSERKIWNLAMNQTLRSQNGSNIHPEAMSKCQSWKRRIPAQPGPSGIVIVSPRTAQEMASEDRSLWIPRLLRIKHGLPENAPFRSFSWMMLLLKPPKKRGFHCQVWLPKGKWGDYYQQVAGSWLGSQRGPGGRGPPLQEIWMKKTPNDLVGGKGPLKRWDWEELITLWRG